ncbi:uncharacterized protein LOC121424498 [Lytechinus variegatus]|uniref:uncharacterized protein LOC121424498 n=1 Tax=Lytechinus variegatus TaxID=7654 RepID=UPI001BB11DB6|nr:uncharacterized protein LOC121424498 [Lytechinus variegatus]
MDDVRKDDHSVDELDANQVKVFLWCSPRTVSTAFTKCMSFIEGMEIWSEPFVYCYLSSKEVKKKLNVDLPFVLEGNEDIYAKTTELIRTFTGSNVITERIVYANVKPRLEAAKGRYVFVKDMCLGISKETYQYLPKGFRHTFLIRTPERALYSFRNSYYHHGKSHGLLEGPAADYDTFDVTRDDPHMDDGYYTLAVYEFWKYVRSELEEEPIVIDADDLLTHPKEMLKKYCELVGLPFSESLLQWDSSLDTFKTWKQCGDDQLMQMADFYGRAMHSSCFMPPSKQVPRDQMTPDVIKGIEMTMASYQEMYEHRIKI